MIFLNIQGSAGSLSLGVDSEGIASEGITLERIEKVNGLLSPFVKQAKSLLVSTEEESVL